jgi:hypothetical protein
MVSDVKSCAGAIFGLNPEFFVRGYPHNTQPECHVLLVNPHGEHTKFAPILFLHPERPNKDEFLKTAKLVQVSAAAVRSRTTVRTGLLVRFSVVRSMVLSPARTGPQNGSRF